MTARDSTLFFSARNWAIFSTFGAFSLHSKSGEKGKPHRRTFKNIQWRRRPEITDVCPLSFVVVERVLTERDPKKNTQTCEERKTRHFSIGHLKCQQQLLPLSPGTLDATSRVLFSTVADRSATTQPQKNTSNVCLRCSCCLWVGHGADSKV